MARALLLFLLLTWHPLAGPAGAVRAGPTNRVARPQNALAPYRTYLPILPGREEPPADRVLVAEADAMVMKGYPNSNTGGWLTVWAGNDTSEYQAGVVRSLVRFGLRDLPAAPVVSAALRLYYAGYWDREGYSRSITASTVLGPWEEHLVTWATQPQIGPELDYVVIVANEKWAYQDIDVTEAVNQWLNGNKANFGVYLRGPEVESDDSAYRAFATRETSTPPLLVVRFGGQ